MNVQILERWEEDYIDELTTELRAINSILSSVRTVEVAEELAVLYHRLPIMEYHLFILQFGDDDSRFALFEDVNGID